jgi:pimeloyl-ACP methyl ester carboxylesterase
MTATSQAWTEQTVSVAGTQLNLINGGSGEPLLVLHDEMGHQNWLGFHAELAQHYALQIPQHPGFGSTPRQDWIMNMRDLACWYLRALEELEVESINVLGLSWGGWLAAEMATLCPHLFKKVVLVGAPGIRPPSGEIYDMFLVVAREYIEACFLNSSTTEEFQQVCPQEPTPEQTLAWDVAKEEACRLSWRPYMFYPALPQLLGRVKRTPTLIVWGKEDAIVPLSVGEAYQEAIQGSRLVVLNNCGHRPEVEQSDEFVRVVHQFLSEP